VGEVTEGLSVMEVGEGTVDQGLKTWTVRIVACPVVYTVSSVKIWVQKVEVLIIVREVCVVHSGQVWNPL
jgi:hypothetical protein